MLAMFIEIYPQDFPPEFEALAVEAADLIALVTRQEPDPESHHVWADVESVGDELIARPVVDLVDAVYADPSAATRPALVAFLRHVCEMLEREAS